MIPIKTPVELSRSPSGGFIVGDRVRVNSAITRRVGIVSSILEDGCLVVHFPLGYKKNSAAGFLTLFPSECWKVK